MVEYVLTCQGSLAMEQFQKLMARLDGWMVNAKIAPEIYIMIKAALINWKEGQRYLNSINQEQ